MRCGLSATTCGSSGPYGAMGTATPWCKPCHRRLPLPDLVGRCPGRTVRWNNNDFKWEVWNNSGNVFFRNKSTGMCLDDSRTYGLQVIGCNYGVWQQWR